MKFNEIINLIRKKEILKLKYILIIDYLNRSLAMGSHVIASFLVFLSVYLNGDELSVSLMFPTFYVMNTFRGSILRNAA